MRIRLYNARILSMEEEKKVFHGEVWVQEEKISAILDYGKESREVCDRKAGSGVWDQELDCEENLLMPGFKNAHTHSPMTFLRSFADDLPLQKWLQDIIFPMEAKLNDDYISQFGKLAVLEYLSGGITGIFDMYLRPDVMAGVCMDMGMRCTLVSGLNDFTSSLEQQEEEFLRLNQVSPLIRYHLGCHAEYTTSLEKLKGLSELAAKYSAPVFLHLCETQKEVRDCQVRYGKTPAEFLDSLGLFEYGGGGYHCLFLNEKERDIFVRKKLYAVTCPASNLKLASGIAPITEYDRLGIPVAIGTDGPASNNCLDMFREMFLVCGLAKYQQEDASVMSPEKVLRMATVNGAYAMGRKDADVLAAGKMADLIMIDLHQPSMQPIHNIQKNLVYSGSRALVKMTMIAGRILYHNGKYYTGETPDEIYDQCESSMKKLMSQ